MGAGDNYTCETLAPHDSRQIMNLGTNLRDRQFIWQLRKSPQGRACPMSQWNECTSWPQTTDLLGASPMGVERVSPCLQIVDRVYLDQLISLWSLNSSNSAITWECVRKANSQAPPDLLNKKLWGWGPAIYVLANQSENLNHWSKAITPSPHPPFFFFLTK